MYVCMYVCVRFPSPFNLGRSFDSISLKLGRTVVSMENWSCIVFGSIRSDEEGARGYAISRIFRK